MVITKGFVQPYSMAFLPDGGILVTERPGRLRLVRNGVLQAEPIAGLPPIYAKGIGGLMDIALHPRFAENSLIYFTYVKDRPRRVTPARTHPAFSRSRRGRWTGTAITGFEDLFTAVQANVPSRIIFGRDGMLYMSVASGDPPASRARSGPQRPCRQDPPPARRRQSAAGQSLRRARRISSGNLHHGPSRAAWSGHQSRYRRHLGMRKRA